MRCHICDAVLTEPQFNSDLDTYEPCGTCLAIAMEAAGQFVDRPSASEDELGEDTTIADLYGALAGAY